jgi:two-component system sensor histidine kinase QseC
MTRSLKWRLIIATATATALILGLSGITLDAFIRRSLTDEFDASLQNTARAHIALIEQHGSKTFIDTELKGANQFKRPARPEYFEVRDETAKSSTPSQSLGDATLSMPAPPPAPAAQSIVEPMTLPDGRPGHAVAIRFKPQFRVDESEDPPATQHMYVYVLARDVVSLNGTLAQMRGLLLSVCSGATIVSAALMAWIIRRGLRSTGKLATRIARIDDNNLAQRIEVDGVPSEIQPIVNRLNDLLKRLQDAFVREKSFSADVAHELRTPLSGLETALEVSASQRRSPEEYERVIQRCLDVCRRMHAMVDNLLMLARAESKQLVVQRESMDLAELCREAWSLFQARADERKLRVEWRAPEDCIVESDQEKIRLLLNNFFDNAVSYTDMGGQIIITIQRTPKARLEVSNSGSRLAGGDASHVFERFWRGDRARTGGTHCGLGLTLCKNIADALGGKISAKSDGGIFSVSFELAEPAREIPVIAGSMTS